MLKEFNREVLYTNRDLVKVSEADIEALKEKSLENKHKSIRLYCHKYNSDTSQEILIIHTQGAYIRPHKHLNKSESFYIVEGKASVVLFDEEGNIEEIIPMGEYLSGRKVYYRMSRPCYHTLIVYTDFLVFHKITKGPFQKADTVFAPWAPQKTDVEACLKYIQRLKGMAKNYEQ